MARQIRSLDPSKFFGYLGVVSGPAYHSLRKIATGRFGTIQIGYLSGDASGTVYAIKELEIASECYAVSSDIIREVSLLKELDHENIVRLLHVTVKPHHVCLTFERFPWDLLYFMSDKRIAKNDLTIKNFMHQILSAVAYCHSNKIIHRDLKPANVLIDLKTYKVKLCDFGLARDFGVPLASYTEKTEDLFYKAPEILFGKGQYTNSIDVWAVGCIFAWMKTGEILFQTKEKDELLGIFSVLGTPTEKTWPGVTKLCGNCTFPKYKPVVLNPQKLNHFALILFLKWFAWIQIKGFQLKRLSITHISLGIRQAQALNQLQYSCTHQKHEQKVLGSQFEYLLDLAQFNTLFVSQQFLRRIANNILRTVAVLKVEDLFVTT